MKIEKQPKIILTMEESETFERVIGLLNSIVGNCDGADIGRLAAIAAMELSNFWGDDAVEVE